MNIGRMRERITIQKSEVEIDKYYNHKNKWIDFYSCYAYILTYARDEQTDVLTHDERTVMFEVRYCTELRQLTSTEYRILHRGFVYNIVDVDLMNFNRKSIHIKGRREDIESGNQTRRTGRGSHEGTE